ncbi:glutathione S-transferase D4-like isoform X2 [Convolutriloba macropyga]|uniref:glutathione S-transferase D4-like isoform X2 n=1 Tax=Convolutriloba macropyga TaxID=536237 RepID=UPI003F522966
MAVERRGFNSASWGTSYNMFFGPPPESFRFIEPYTPHVDAIKDTKDKAEGVVQIPLVECAVSHGARCLLSTANAIDMDSSFITKYIQVQPLYIQADGSFDPFWVKLIKYEHGYEEDINEPLAMMRYMCSKFQGGECYLYPTNNPRRIFEIDSKLSYDLTQMQPCVLSVVEEVIRSHKLKPVSDGNPINARLSELESILSKQKYVADDHISLADISMITTITMLEIVQFDFSKYPAVLTWMRLVKSLPFYTVSNFGFEQYTKDAIAELST